jgi:uncharacterized membrane protein
MNAGAPARARRSTLAVWLGLLALLVAWHAAGGAAGLGTAILAAVALPLLLPLPGLWRGRRRTFRWAPLTLAPALAWALTEILANPPARGFAVGSALLAFLALAAVVATLRSMPAAS